MHSNFFQFGKIWLVDYHIQTFSSLEKFDYQSTQRWLTWYIYVVAGQWSILRIPLWISRPKPWPRWIIWHFLKLTELLPMLVKQHQFSWSANGKERDAHRMWLCLRFWHVGFKAVWSSLILPPRCLAVCVAPCFSRFFSRCLCYFAFVLFCFKTAQYIRYTFAWIVKTVLNEMSMCKFDW